jgi:mono/diheme cytochrome c family protein
MKLPQCEAQKLYLTLQKMRTCSTNHIFFSGISQLSHVKLNPSYTEDTSMKKLLIPFFVTTLILSACATATVTPPPTVEPVIVTSTLPPTETPFPTNTVPPTVEVVQPTSVPPTENVASNVSFANEVLPIFQTYCVECHGGLRTREGLNMTSYDALMAGSFNGAVIIPGNANESITVQLIAASEMPERGPAVSNVELQLIIDWINQGAQNN